MPILGCLIGTAKIFSDLLLFFFNFFLPGNSASWSPFWDGEWVKTWPFGKWLFSRDQPNVWNDEVGSRCLNHLVWLRIIMSKNSSYLKGLKLKVYGPTIHKNLIITDYLLLASSCHIKTNFWTKVIILPPQTIPFWRAHPPKLTLPHICIVSSRLASWWFQPIWKILEY